MIGVGISIAMPRVLDSFVGILDLYPGASVAYSLRKLRADYTGAAIRIRRSGDNSETDIGFLPNGEFDVASAQAFCIAGGGSQNGFIVTRYDQSGNGNNATQTTAAQQVQCVNSGVFYIQDGKPCSFNNNNAKAPIATAVNLQNNYAVFCVAKPTQKDKMLFGSKGDFSSLSYYYLNDIGSGTGYGFSFRSNSNVNDYSAQTAINVNRLFYSTNEANNLNVGYNNTNLISATDSQIFTLSILETGFNSSDFYRFRGYFFELIAYSTFPDVTGIKSNINNYYGIY